MIILLRLAKTLFFAIVIIIFGHAILAIVSLTITPLIPDFILDKTKGSLFYMIAKSLDDKLISLAGLVILLHVTSLFYIFFKIFRQQTFITKSILPMLIFLVVLYLVLSKVWDTDLERIIAGVTPILIAGGMLSTKLIRKLLTREKKVKIKQTEDSLIFALSKGQVILNNPYRGIYIQGGAGSGKSVSLFEPIIQQVAGKKFTGLLYDFKSPELTIKAMSLYKQHTDISSFFVDFKNPHLSNRLNPIDPKYLFKTAYAIEYATVLINNLIPESIKKMDYWNSNAKMILAGIIWYLRNQFPHYCTLPHVISVNNNPKVPH